MVCGCRTGTAAPAVGAADRGEQANISAVNGTCWSAPFFTRAAGIVQSRCFEVEFLPARAGGFGGACRGRIRSFSGRWPLLRRSRAATKPGTSRRALRHDSSPCPCDGGRGRGFAAAGLRIVAENARLSRHASPAGNAVRGRSRGATSGRHRPRSEERSEATGISLTGAA